MKLATCTVPLFATMALLAQSTTEVIVPLPMRGMMAAYDAGMMFSDDPSRIVRKGRNLPVHPSTFAGIGGGAVAEFTVAAIEAQLRLQAANPQLVPALDIVAFSTGNDLLPLVFDTGTQRYRIASASTDGWAALLLTLEPDNGQPLYAGAPASVDGATVFGYYFRNPAFPSQLQQSVYHELLRSDFGSGSPTLASTANISSLDVAMGLIHSNRGALDFGVINTVDRLYFVLSRQCAKLLEDSHAVANPLGLPIDGATVFVAHFDVANKRVALVDLCSTQLGMSGVQIDALGMAEVRAQATPGPGEVPLTMGSMMFVVSAEAGQLPEELMVVARPQGTPSPAMVPGRLRTDQGNRLVGGGGLLQGRVKGLCAKDPETSHGAASFGVPTGTPTLGATFPNSMNLSITASWTQSDPVWDNVTFDGVVTGCDRPADALPVFALGMGDPSFGLQPTWFTWLLPVCPAGTTDYTFELPLQLVWLTGMAPNLYDVFVAMVPLSGPGPIEATYTTWFRRTYTP
ncbi:MAG: hypothetical protein U1F60_14520 [Planctomycetota bacterium]